MHPSFVAVALLVAVQLAVPAHAQDAGTHASAPALQQQPRPSSESVQEPASRLFRAIVADDPRLVEDFFFPRDAFLKVKAMQKPERYWQRLHARFEQDIHALSERLRRETENDPSRASFVRLELTRRGGWVERGQEGNALPYWAARHALLHYRVGAQPRTLEVRVLISWQQAWYVIHLSEFH